MTNKELSALINNFSSADVMFNLSETAQRLLREALNSPTAAFRPGQFEAISEVLEGGRRLLLVERTGWGKSMVYFIITKILRQRGGGPSLIISPLLSLMRDQIKSSANLNLHSASINSDNHSEWTTIKSQIDKDGIDILLVAPERLASENFLNDYLTPLVSRVSFLIVDEAHCISDWGHDFRPDYRRIGRIARLVPPNIPFLATTATADDNVTADVVRQLGGRLAVQRGPLRRKSLRLQVVNLRQTAQRLAWLSEHIPNLPSSGIVYTLTTGDAELVANWLSECGISAAAYHSRIETDNSGRRAFLETQLHNNDFKVLAATIALGMGFDKPDIGFVIHYQMPKSVIHYYQQVGRAGRSLDEAYGVLFHGVEDAAIHDYFDRTSLPSEEDIQLVLSALEESPDGLSKAELESAVNLSSGDLARITTNLCAHSPQPIRLSGGRWLRTPAAYHPDPQTHRRLIEQRRRERDTMQRYLLASECHMRFLVRALNDPDGSDCGVCAVCRGKPVVPITVSENMLRRAQNFLNSIALPISPRKRCSPGGLSGLGIPSASIPADLQNKIGRALCRWGQPPWGELVARGKYTDRHFDDKLAAAAAELISSRWLPSPYPKWGTCIPSLRDPKLTMDFARRLCINWPFHFSRSLGKCAKRRRRKPSRTAVIRSPTFVERMKSPR